MLQKRVYFINPASAAVQAIPAAEKITHPPEGWIRCSRRDYERGLAVKRNLARRALLAA